MTKPISRIVQPSWLVLLFAVTVALAGCTDTADTFPMNNAAHEWGPSKFRSPEPGLDEGLS